MNKVLAIIVGAAFGLGGAAGAIALLKSHPAGRHASSGLDRSRVAVPDRPVGPRQGFRCKPADCGAEVNLYLRAKIGFCNCADRRVG